MTSQVELFGDDRSARTLLGQLLTDSKLFRTGKAYQQLLDFVVRLRNVAPFNAMLLQIQKPGVTHVASAHEWKVRFDRHVKEGARPLLILWPFGPVATVYDILDTDGAEVPAHAFAFPAHGAITVQMNAGFRQRMAARGIMTADIDAGDGKAGAIRAVYRTTKSSETPHYQVFLNRNHPPAVQFATIAHELAHLFLGHLGGDKVLSVPDRPIRDRKMRELEAESVSFLVSARSGVTSKAEAYLSACVEADTSVDDIDIYQVMRAAGQVETMLGLVMNTRFERPR